MTDPPKTEPSRPGPSSQRGRDQRRASQRGSRSRHPPPDASPVEWDPEAETRCVHVRECGACPAMYQRYERQVATKAKQVVGAWDGYPAPLLPQVDDVVAAADTARYRRRAKLVIGRDDSGATVIGLYRRHQSEQIVDIPQCEVLTATLMSVVGTIRQLCDEPPAAVGDLLRPVVGEEGVLTGVELREVRSAQATEIDGGAEPEASVLAVFSVVAERAPELAVLRAAAADLVARIPSLVGVSVLRRSTADASSRGTLTVLVGPSELRDQVRGGYQYATPTSFLPVHNDQAQTLYGLVGKLVGATRQKVLDLYGGNGAIALSLLQDGHEVTSVESFAPAAALAQRAAVEQKLPLRVVTGDVATIAHSLASKRHRSVDVVAFDVVVANPPRRGMSPAAREAVAALAPARIVYVACDLHNLARDVAHLSRLGYQIGQTVPIDMLPQTDEVEVIAVLERAEPPPPEILFNEDGILALNKPSYEPADDRPEYPTSLAGRARAHVDGGAFAVVAPIEASTSGICVFARDESIAAVWRQAFERTGRFVYLAACRGVTPAKGAITRELRDADGSHNARTRYRRLAIGGGHSILRVVPERRHVHQIRRHLAAIGHPILGDARYGHAPTNRYFEEKHGLDRSYLHLVRVEVTHPAGGSRVVIEAPLAPELCATLVRCSDRSVLTFLQNKRALGRAGNEKRPAGERASRSGAPERSPLSVHPESVAEPNLADRAPARGRAPSVRTEPIAFDSAPRTIRGELVTPDDYDDD